MDKRQPLLQTLPKHSIDAFYSIVAASCIFVESRTENQSGVARLRLTKQFDALSSPLVLDETLYIFVEQLINLPVDQVGTYQHLLVYRKQRRLRALHALVLIASGSNLTFESWLGFPMRARRASLRDARRKIPLRFVRRYSPAQ
ncbi:MAG: hypothetical protein WA397_05620, partial [Roseiarcus sp.]